MFDQAPERESMDFDVVIVGAGPAGLAAAIRLKQRAEKAGEELNVVVVEKGSEVGAHILSGAVLDPSGLDALLPDWKERGAPIDTPVTAEAFKLFGPSGSIPLPGFLMPPMVKNHGCYVVSMGNVCRWLAEQAESLGVEIYPGMAASKPLFREDGSLKGVVVGEMGIGRDGEPTDRYEPGMELNGKYVLIAEGARGSLAKTLIAKYELDAQSDPQKFGIGLKELWEIAPEKARPGYVQHTFGWPLKDDVGGGSFLYHYSDNTIALGFVVHLNYKNPYLYPYGEFQRFKTHPEIAALLEGGKRIAYGARAITEGGYQSTPKLVFPGGALIGCAAGFVNVPRIKGNHNAMLTGIMAADAAFDAISEGRAGDALEAYEAAYRRSPVRRELYQARNVKPLWTKFGTFFGGIALSGLDLWTNALAPGFSLFGTLRHGKTDAEATEPADKHKPIDYPKPDGVLTFDRLTNLAFSGVNHEEDQPCHLRLKDPEIPIRVNLPTYAEPAQRYCPAGVYEVVYEDGGSDPRFQINAQNCVHCKTCDIKDPSQNIDWVTPEGGGGPNYPNM
ncbi:electron transfer flavoprotein-ubiquinone oxidoreductase [Amphiplicatus metriothermophilus]|uniref:Electron transfer flavoprotein-ubiquinone oxidoreductase n=1 Tax=Amphiplicatus metriothermophilus TaxID=1519374 RepID=A0A239PIP2_9PROT|nr:electron transfer flavoprotein-ubiquinone oxidoreductase [Amphiplicatus metriothermophilus]MBB5518010.1 electron-transferring-flavoprotein dehydrogenase [Amphiplicatus metriothermophilus]SNT67656.1 electron-transferring-flavoprotein dehydrogenase [Amphiplicatus metriothermophilus]